MDRADDHIDQLLIQDGRTHPRWRSWQVVSPYDRRDRNEPARTTKLAPEAELPAQPERREEAPVISLNSRRRESADQLEDEMARLLGELTSDNKGR